MRHLPRFLLVAAAAILVAVLGYSAFVRWLGESPMYPKCVAAMEIVATGQSRSEAEALVATAEAAGGERWELKPEDATFGPDGPPDLGMAAGTVVVWCARYDPDLGVDMGDNGGILQSLQYYGQLNWHGGFNRSRFEFNAQRGTVLYLRAHDCRTGGVDSEECRDRTVPDAPFVQWSP
jgi:hypothetical protein